MNVTTKNYFLILLFFLSLSACNSTKKEITEKREKASNDLISAQLDSIFNGKYEFPEREIHKTFHYKDGVDGFFVMIEDKEDKGKHIGVAFFENISDSLNYLDKIKSEYLLRLENPYAFMCEDCNNCLYREIHIGGENDSNGYLRLSQTWGPHQCAASIYTFLYNTTLKKWLLGYFGESGGYETDFRYTGEIDREKFPICLDTFNVEMHNGLADFLVNRSLSVDLQEYESEEIEY